MKRRATPGAVWGMLRPLMSAPVQKPVDLVQLDPDHPGFRDEVYRLRRNQIAELAAAYRAPAPVPQVDYSDVEHGVWRTIWKSLAPLHDTLACEQYQACSANLRLPKDSIPQLREVNLELARRSGFQMHPVAGLVSSRDFLGYLRRNAFLSTQYMRHHSVPLYTPEPDIVHELVGHAATFADPTFVALNQNFGAAAERASDAALVRIERAYWFTLEFGVVREAKALKAYGAGLLSSFGELERFRTHTQLLPFDLEQMSAKPYDPTTYQGTLYVAESLDQVRRDVTAWLNEVAPQRGTP